MVTVLDTVGILSICNVTHLCSPPNGVIPSVSGVRHCLLELLQHVFDVVIVTVAAIYIYMANAGRLQQIEACRLDVMVRWILGGVL